MHTVIEARSLLLEAVSPLQSTEVLTLGDGLGRVLAHPELATFSVPSADNSAMDGYAFSAEDHAKAGGELPISARIHAGDAPASLVRGSAARIFTGATVPAGANVVAMQERCVECNDMLRIAGEVKAGQNIRYTGEDFQVGDTLLEAGHRLKPQDVGLLASAGIDQVEVVRRARVAVLSTGNELVTAGEQRRAGRIYDSNGPMLCALLTQLGCTVLPASPVADSPTMIRSLLDAAAAQADFVISTGGVSVGESDYVRHAVEDLGHLDLWRIAVKPGKPVAFGVIRDTPFIGLPGNPVAAFVTFCLLAAPAIRRLQGRCDPVPVAVRLPAAFNRPAAPLEEYLRVCVKDGKLHPHMQQGSGILTSVVRTDGLAQVHTDHGVRFGDLIDFLSFETLSH
ncbi:MAG TPA: molybdopterin molybdotransferase MoeA [Woeseiaceae bacterium]|nr:molybdopterin molybdotransferase MoeA [Woeseiaceae bacterium]